MLIKALKFLFGNRSSSSKIKYLRKSGMNIGNGCTLYALTNSFGSEPFLITIGNNCTITRDCKFLTHDGGVKTLINMGITDKADLFGKIKIGNNVFIGVNSVVMKNITIGDNVIVGAGSVVTKDIPNNSVVAGVPARRICSIEEYFEKNKESFDYTRGMSPKEKKDYLIKKYNKE